MWSSLKQHPFSTYGILSIILFFAIQMLNFQYDDGGAVGILMLSVPIWGVVYWAPQELLFSVSGGEGFEGQVVLAVLFGFSACVIADYLLLKSRNRPSKR